MQTNLFEWFGKLVKLVFTHRSLGVLETDRWKGADGYGSMASNIRKSKLYIFIALLR